MTSVIATPQNVQEIVNGDCDQTQDAFVEGQRRSYILGCAMHDKGQARKAGLCLLLACLLDVQKPTDLFEINLNLHSLNLSRCRTPHVFAIDGRLSDDGP